MTIKSFFISLAFFKQSLGTTREWPIAGFQPREKAAILVDKTIFFRSIFMTKSFAPSGMKRFCLCPQA